MAANVWLGKALATTHSISLQPRNIRPGSIWKLRSGAQVFEYTVPSGIIYEASKQATLAKMVCDELVARSQASGGTFAGGTAGVSFESAISSDSYVIVATGGNGEPLDVELTGDDADSAGVRVSQLQAGSSGLNEKQLIQWPQAPTGGHWGIQYGAETTDTITDYALDGTDSGITAGSWTVSGGEASTATGGIIDFAVTTTNGGEVAIAFTAPGGNIQFGVGTTNFVQFAADSNVRLLVLPLPSGSHTVRISGVASGTYKVRSFTVREHTLAYNVNAATVESALEGITAIGSGNVAVSGSASAGYTVEFQGSLAGTACELLTARSSTCTGTAAAIVSKSSTGARTARTYLLASSLFDGNSDTFLQFQYGDQLGHIFSQASSDDTIRDAVVSASGLVSSSVSVVSNQDGSKSIVLLPTGTSIDTLAILNASVPTTALSAMTLVTEEAAPDVTVVSVRILNAPNSLNGTIAFEYLGDTATVSLARTMTVESNPPTASILNLAINGGTVSAGRNAISGWYCTSSEFQDGDWVMEFEWLDQLEPYRDPGILTVDVSGMRGCHAIGITKIQQSRPIRSEIQQVVLTASPTGGTFTLSYGGNTTSALAYNAAASTIQTALQGLASVGSGNMLVSGPSGGPWIVKAAGSLAGTDIASITGNGASLTLSTAASVTQVTLAAVTGPNWWTNKDNWSLGNVPTGTDVATFSSGSVPCRYGLTSVGTFAGLDVYRSYTGEIGLSSVTANGLPETRTQYLGLTDNGSVFPVRIGLGDEGNGPSLVKINAGSQDATVSVVGAGATNITEGYNVYLAGALNSVQVSGGSVAIARESGTTATVGTLRVLGQQSGGQEAICEWGSGAAVTTVEVQNGVVRAGSVPQYLTVVGSTSVVRGSGTIKTIEARTSTIRYDAAGQIGRSGLITDLGDVDDEMSIESTAHGLRSGDVVFIVGLETANVPAGFYSVVRVDADNFVLSGVDSIAVTSGIVSSYVTYYGGTGAYLAGARWGLANCIKLGEETVLDFSAISESRTIVAPITIQSETARIRDPLKSVANLRFHSNPGMLDEDFGLNSIFRREDYLIQ